ncbi:MAG: 4Fe-4S dicluster domain-containing protein [Dehalococcoidia bacterium]|nr:MAG: 4Fe-4S dicluster domain-containing protein [Dehalococcoidia bacterium]
MQYGFYFDQNRCTGCFACVVACRDWHDVPAGPACWLRVKTVEKGRYPDLFVTFLPMTCYHCQNPACVAACPQGAITKREDGIVTIDSQKCLGKDGCQLCFEACPYGAPQFGPEEDASVQKCDLCRERWAERQKPVCVDSCPTQALDAGHLDDLKVKYGEARDAEGFTYSEELRPSIIFKPRKDTGHLPLRRIIVTPDREMPG